MAGHESSLREVPNHPIVATNADEVLTDKVEDAWKKLCDTLKPEMREEFEQYESLGGLPEYLETLQLACEKTRDNSSGFRFIEWLTPLFETVQLLTPPASIMVNAYPNPASLILGGIVAVTQAAQRIPEYQKRTVQMLAEMGRTTQALLEYQETIYKEEEDIRLALVEIYGDILSFCDAALEIIAGGTESRFKSVKLRHLAMSVLRNYDSRLGDKVQTFKQHVKGLELRASVCDRKRLHQMLQGLNAHRKEFTNQSDQAEKWFRRQEELQKKLEKREMDSEEVQERSNRKKEKLRLLEWLSQTSFRSSYDQKCDEHLGGTGSWLLASREYKSWKESPESDLLWINGKPGCGKSVLAAVTISDLPQKDPDTAVAYAFCQRSRESFHSTDKIFRALAAQLCRQQPSINNVLRSDLEEYGPKEPPSLRTTRNAMRVAISHFQETFIVVDGLDECSDTQSLVEEIINLLGDAGARVKVIIFSRNDLIIGNAIGELCIERSRENLPLPTTIQLDHGANSMDLQMYISTLFPKDAQSEITQEIHKQCMDKAEGMFLWVKLLHQNLNKVLNNKQKLQQIKDVPKGLKSLYDLIFDDIWTQGKYVRPTAMLVLLWTMCGMRTLHVSEMMEAVADFSDATHLNEGHRQDNPQHLVTACANLVTIDKDGYFRPLHDSVRMYLDEAANDDSSPLHEYQKQRKGVHHRLANICLRYLLLEDFSIGRATSPNHLIYLSRKFPFLAYAAAFWGTHVALANDLESHTELPLLLESPPRLGLSLQMWYLERSKETAFQSYYTHFHPMHVVSLFGLHQIAEETMVRRPTRPKDELLRTSLNFALLGKQLAMAKWILKNIRDSGEWLAPDKIRKVIHTAATTGWEDIMKRILSRNKSYVGSKLTPDGPTPLTAACKAGHIEVTRVLIEENADINRQDGSQRTPLITAVRNADKAMVRFLLDRGAATDRSDGSGKTPLHHAVLTGSGPSPYALTSEGDYSHIADRRASTSNILQEGPLASPGIIARTGLTRPIELLLKSGAPLDAQDAEGFTAIHYAVERRSVSIVNILLAFGCDVGIQNNDGDNAIHLASSYGTADILSLVTNSLEPGKRRALINVPGYRSSTALHASIRAGRVENARFLIDQGADLTAVDIEGSTPLLYTARSGMVDLLRPLLESTQSPNYHDRQMNTALHLAAEYGRLEYITTFLQACEDIGLNADVSAVNEYQFSALHIALNHGHEDVAMLLIEKGACSKPNVDGEYPLHLAAKKGFDSIVQRLLQQSVTPVIDRAGETPLLEAAFYGHISTAQILAPCYLSSLSQPNSFGVTPLAAALSQQHFGMVHFLLDLGAQPTQIKLDGLGPLHAAAKFGDARLVERLIEAGYQDNAAGPLQLWPSHCGAYSGNLGILSTLQVKGYDTIYATNAIGERSRDIAAQVGDLQMLKQLDLLGAEKGARNHFGWSAGFKAIDKGHLNVLKYLLQQNEELGDTDVCGNSPLIMATRRGYQKIVEYVIDMQPSTLDVFNSLGNSPLSIAASNNNVTIAQTLLEAGANPYLKDAFGMDAFDYAVSRPALSQALHGAHYLEILKDLNPQKQIPMTHVSLHRYCQQILSFSTALNLVEQYKRCRVIFALHDVLVHLGDDSASRLCLLDACWPQGGLELRQRRICQLCEKKMASKEMYHCTSPCHLTVLCPSCHDDYRREKRIPAAYTQLWNLERKVQVVRAAVSDDLTVTEISKALHHYQSNKDWCLDLLRRYDFWKKTYNSTGRYNALKKPGHDFLRIVQSVQDHLSEIRSHEGIEHQNSSNLQSLEMQLRKNERENPANREIIDRECNDLSFIRVSAIERQQLMEPGADLDSQNGRLTPTFIRSLMDKYPISTQEDLPSLDILHWNPSSYSYPEASTISSQIEDSDGETDSPFEAEPISRSSTVSLAEELSKSNFQPLQGLRRSIEEDARTDDLLAQQVYRSDTLPSLYEVDSARASYKAGSRPLHPQFARPLEEENTMQEQQDQSEHHDTASQTGDRRARPRGNSTTRDAMTRQRSGSKNSTCRDATKVMIGEPLKCLRTRKQEVDFSFIDAAGRRTEVLGDPANSTNRVKWYAVMFADRIKPGSQELLLYEEEHKREESQWITGR